MSIFIDSLLPGDALGFTQKLIHKSRFQNVSVWSVLRRSFGKAQNLKNPDEPVSKRPILANLGVGRKF
jgi:hypothetical protein